MYTIQILKGGEAKRNRVMQYLAERIEKDGRFRATLAPAYDKRLSADAKQHPGMPRMLPSIHVSPVRLTKAKPYCGQHPGECVVNPFLGPQPKKRLTYLEWEDWVKFHDLVNKALNRFRTEANVWSNPPDVRGKMWIRKGLRSRVRFDWTETRDRFGRPIREWNPGTDDQFGPPVGGPSRKAKPSNAGPEVGVRKAA